MVRACVFHKEENCAGLGVGEKRDGAARSSAPSTGGGDRRIRIETFLSALTATAGWERSAEGSPFGSISLLFGDRCLN